MRAKPQEAVRLAVQFIHQAGALLVFPIDNKRDPDSLWYRFHPKSEMRWEWDADGDHRVADLWHLKTELSITGKVVYTKWYRGRATYFSKPLFTAFLRKLNPALNDTYKNQATLSQGARKILEILQAESPLSTKELKRLADMRGRENERVYEKALKELWARLLIVAYGEVDDGAFPSLAVGATETLFEQLWSDALELSFAEADKTISKTLDQTNLFYKFYKKLEAEAPLKAESHSEGAGSRAKAKKQASQKKFSVVDFKDL
jgi:hypothetical protein